jgi:hypothetical protein
MAEGWRDILSVMTEHRVTVDEYRELDGGRVLVSFHLSGRGRTSGLDLSAMQVKVASLFQDDALNAMPAYRALTQSSDAAVRPCQPGQSERVSADVKTPLTRHHRSTRGSCRAHPDC